MLSLRETFIHITELQVNILSEHTGIILGIMCTCVSAGVQAAFTGLCTSACFTALGCFRSLDYHIPTEACVLT